MRLHSPQWVAVAATLVVVGGSVTAGYLHWHDDEKAPPAQAAADVPVQPGMEEAHAVATALGQLADKPAELVAADVQSAIAGRAAEAVPKGSTITPNEASWHPDGLGGGTMTVTVTLSGKPAVTYSAIMVKEKTGWKVVGTMPMALTGTSAAPAGAGQAPAAEAPAAQNPAGTKAVPVNPTSPDGRTAGVTGGTGTSGTTSKTAPKPATQPKKSAPATEGAGR
jgi:hypothetical protein